MFAGTECLKICNFYLLERSKRKLCLSSRRVKKKLGALQKMVNWKE